MLGRVVFISLTIFLTCVTADIRSCNEVIEYSDPRSNFFVGNITSKLVRKRQVDPIFIGHPKTQQEVWHQNFKIESIIKVEDILVQLLAKLVEIYLKDCIPIVIYDKYIEESDGVILQRFFKNLNITYIHGKIDRNYKLMNKGILQPLDSRCRSYILFLSDILRARDILGPQTTSRVVIVSRSTQWKQLEFLSSKSASDLINLVVIGESVGVDSNKDHPYVLYTHRLYTDGLGSNTPVVLTSWMNKKLSRPHLNLFPRKFLKGFAGHRFTVSGYHKPPFAIKKISMDGVGNTAISWDGFEFRMLKILSQRLNFTFDIIEPTTKNKLGPTYGVIEDISRRRADIGIAGAYVASERLSLIDMSTQHSSDCAAFITLASKALPRYRAIMGPFQWPVWVAITAIYLLAIFPLAFSDKLTLSHLIGNWSEIENMFWYVFGTFTNSLTFTGRNSWSCTKKSSTRLLIGWYWVFTIIITACYTSSIIAFVTLPIFPETVDSISGLLNGFFRVGTLENDGWQFWFLNSSHAQTSKLIKNLEFVVDVEEGLSNVTRAWFWPYAFIGSKSQLEFIVRDNYTDE
uniref:Ionotropic receptor 21a n=1 Tax=Bradysia odoriphaga TaxID=1564500 RepID=A0A6B9C9Z0_9DIPT|nr:ionotropic receptor 21a [Bradysia odoriphaga]